MNSWSSGEAITPLSDADARKWAEKNLDGEDYEKIFSVEEPEEGKKIQSFSLSGDVIAKLTQLSREHKTCFIPFMHFRADVKRLPLSRQPLCSLKRKSKVWIT